MFQIKSLPEKCGTEPLEVLYCETSVQSLNKCFPSTYFYAQNPQKVLHLAEVEVLVYGPKKMQQRAMGRFNE